jgi:hypothetical protein
LNGFANNGRVSLEDVRPETVGEDNDAGSLGDVIEKGRGVLEILVYAVLILGVVLSIWQFAQTPNLWPGRFKKFRSSRSAAVAPVRPS